MKNLIPTLIILMLSFSASAQYKKASFFEKEGRTYEIGSRMYMLGDGKGNPLGFSIGFGRDRGGKQFFSSWELQYIPSYAYAYNTVDDNEDAVAVSGHSRGALIYAPNYGFHLLKNKEGRIVQPYVLAGFNIVLAGGVKDEISTETYGYPKRQTSEQTISMGINGGLGCLVNLSSKFGLKLQGGYDRQFNMSADEWDSDVKPYYMFTHHTYVSLGLRLKVIKD